jgi:FkbM family methyltransferase
VDPRPLSDSRRQAGQVRRARSAVRDVLPYRLAELLAVNRWRQAIACARLMSEPVSFAVREILVPASRSRRGALRRYTLKASGLAFWIRHGTPDVGVFDEIFVQRVYDLPPDARERLGEEPARRILDLGGHIGLSGLALLEQMPAAEILAFEPDETNYRVLERCIDANRLQDRWELRAAAAAASDGELSFAGGLSSGSKAAGDDDEIAFTVPSQDVLPAIAAADVVKMDMEGGEWAVLGDPRFAAAAPPVLVMEYHAHLCPEPAPKPAAHALLADAGYDVSEIFDEEALGFGMLWAVRRTA